MQEENKFESEYLKGKIELNDFSVISIDLLAGLSKNSGSYLELLPNKIKDEEELKNSWNEILQPLYNAHNVWCEKTKGVIRGRHVPILDNTTPQEESYMSALWEPELEVVTDLDSETDEKQEFLELYGCSDSYAELTKEVMFISEFLGEEFEKTLFDSQPFNNRAIKNLISDIAYSYRKVTGKKLF